MKLRKQRHNLCKNGQIKAALKRRKHLQKLSSLDPQDADYRRLTYVRYADDVGLAFTGPKSEAEEIKRQVGRVLREELKLNLSDEKTLVTHARSKAAKFLGDELTILQSATKQSWTKAGFKRRSITGRVGLRVPRAVLTEKCSR